MKTLILADVHANLSALEAVLEHEKTWDEVLFLGDAVGAGPQPDEVLKRLADLKGIWILGNHDMEPFRREIAPDETDPDRRYVRWTRDQISESGRRFVESFELTRVVERQGLVLRLHHGYFPRRLGSVIWSKRMPKPIRKCAKAYAKRFLPPWDHRIWPDTDRRIFTAISKKFSEPYVLLAHSHIQFQFNVGRTVFINPGSVGQPRLGKPEAHYAVLEDGAFHLRHAPYDTQAACRALDRVPLDQSFLDDWKAGYREGRLPDRSNLRDWQPLIDRGYR